MALAGHVADASLRGRTDPGGRRWRWLAVAFVTFAGLIAGRLWQLQVVSAHVYVALASGQQELYRQLFPVRGAIYATERDGAGGERLVPLAVNRPAYLVYADTRRVENPAAVAQALAGPLEVPAADLLPLLAKPRDPYEPLKRRVAGSVAEQIRSLNLSGIGLQEVTERFYPNHEIGSHVLGFVGYRDRELRGQYGVEGRFNALLAGTPGAVRSERDPRGTWIALADRELTPAVDGADVVLTLDWTVQFKACRALDDWVARHGADGGSLITMDPKTGAIVAMCGSPDFNPNTYNETTELEAFNNPAVFQEYEPGSIFKPVTMAAALDQGRITPATTYVDEGVVRIGPHDIRNSDGKAHGLQTMTQVLDESLNTGAIFAMRQAGPAAFRKYVNDFGFGAVTGIELPGEAAGNVRSLNERNEIYPATGSFGQGITVTPLQMVTAYAAIANGGKLVTPHIVREIRFPDGRVQTTPPAAVRQVIAERTAALLSGMLVSVVEHGHGKRAGVPGYFIAGKTGTAQIPRRDGKGYEPGATIGSFVGFGPVEDPRFAMIVRIDRPRDVQFAESSAAPLFGEVAKFLLQYEEVPPRVTGSVH